MMEKEEREGIIQEAYERVLLKLPEVMGNLITNHMSVLEINKQFYSDHPDFKDHRASVQSVVEMVEGKNPNLKHEEILKKSVPLIRKRIKDVGPLDLEKVPEKPNREFTPLPSATIIDKGHGDL